MKNELYSISGIYSITCIPSGKVYIGSSSLVGQRFHQHRSNLGKNKHENKYLQRAWNKYGGNSFIFNLIEEVEKSKLLEVEQVWIDFHRSYDEDCGFNISLFTTSPNKGIVMSDEVRNKISKANKGRTRSAETKERMRLATTGRKYSEDARRKMSEGKRRAGTSELALQHLRNMTAKNSRLCRITEPSGVSYTILGLVPFCRDHKLYIKAMRECATGKRDHYRGWKCEYIDRQEAP